MLTAEPTGAVSTDEYDPDADRGLGRPLADRRAVVGPRRARHVARFQIVGIDGSAWLMVVENGQWWTEARYD